MTAGGYARVSTGEQASSFAGQHARFRAYAAAREWQLREFGDEGISGAVATRPGLAALLAAARQRQVDVIVITKLDRLARSLRQLVALGEELRELGVDLVVLDQSIDTTTSAGRLMFNMLGAFAEFERDLICERVREGVARARAKGVRFGRPRTFRVDEEDVLRRVAAGESYRKIAKDLGGDAKQIQRIVVKSLNGGLRT